MNSNVIHMLSDDELTVFSHYSSELGEIDGKISWPTLERARAHHLDAVRAFENQLPELEEQLERKQSSSSKLWRIQDTYGLILHRGSFYPPRIPWLSVRRLKSTSRG